MGSAGDEGEGFEEGTKMWLAEPGLGDLVPTWWVGFMLTSGRPRVVP